MSLKELRRLLSDIDRQLVELMAARQELAGDIGRAKRTSGTATRDYAREKDVIDMARTQARALDLEADVAEARS